MITYLAVLSLTAHAQDGVDAHDLYVAPQRGDVHSAFTVRTPTGMSRGDFYASTMLEYADYLLVLHQTFADGSRSEQMALGKAAVLNMGLGYAVHDRVRLELAMPLIPVSEGLEGANGFSIGDVRVGGAVGLLSPEDDRGVGVEIAPYINIPSGDESVFLGRNGLGGGGEVATAVRSGGLTVGGSAGIEIEPAVLVRNIDGADKLRLGLSGSFAPTESWGLGAELVAAAAFSKNDVAGVGFPLELRLGSRHKLAHGFTLLGGGAVGLSSGVGASDWRLFLGGSYGPARDVVPAVLEPVVATLHVASTFEGKPVDSAKLSLAAGTGATRDLTVSAAGYDASDLVAGTLVTATVSSGACLVGTATKTLAGGANDLPVAMGVATGIVYWRVMDVHDKSIPGASVTWRGGAPCTPAGALSLADGNGKQDVGFGTYTAVVSAPGYEPVEISVPVLPDPIVERAWLTRTASAGE